MTRVGSSVLSDRPGRAERFAWRAKIRANLTLHLAYRIAVGVIGLAIVVVGVILLPLPGPGCVVVFLGIGVWASEFEWAKWLLRFVKEKVGNWTDWMGRQVWFVRTLIGLGIVFLVLAAFCVMLIFSGVLSVFQDVVAW